MIFCPAFDLLYSHSSAGKCLGDLDQRNHNPKPPVVPFINKDLLSSQCNYIHYKPIHSQTSTVEPLKLGNGYVISSHTLPGMWLLRSKLCNIYILVSLSGFTRHQQQVTSYCFHSRWWVVIRVFPHTLSIKYPPQIIHKQQQFGDEGRITNGLCKSLAYLLKKQDKQIIFHFNVVESTSS